MNIIHVYFFVLIIQTKYTWKFEILIIIKTTKNISFSLYTLYLNLSIIKKLKCNYYNYRFYRII